MIAKNLEERTELLRSLYRRMLEGVKHNLEKDGF